jgi:type I restriction-modification system DNA methylase subunit
LEDALKQISNLIDRFENNLDAYQSPSYNETQLRIEFVDPFFEALGWDVANKSGYAEQYKDVIHEDAIKVSGATKAPDYCFRIGGVRKFFLETKKPSVDIKDQVGPAYQLRRYAWSAKLPLSILTNFAELAIYDCRILPKPADKTSIGRVRFYPYTEYIKSIEEIYNLFSKESVLKGSFDKFAETDRQKRGTTEVDSEFLKEIENWREILAKDIARRNPKLSVRDLNYAVQLTIDRIIFLRMCEDRGIESYGQIQSLLNGTNTYHRLREFFYHADGKYNSGLFDFKNDQLTPELKIDDRPLKDIFKNLYYPDSPYEFSVLGADILGHVYEQFLGKVIRLTGGHQAKVEEKPEVRKAGGIYYTPNYIVDYIVKNTVGKLCEGKKPRQISSIRILDPACGSGSFLLGAYQYLLDYHRDWYQKDGTGKHTKDIYQGRGGQWYLTIQEKKRILLNNIYGVDIDPQAVEVTKLSLLLKVLEGENQDTLERQMKLFRERALPNLESNIKWGNSLIGPESSQGIQLNLLDPDESYRINRFDWEKEFPQIMKQGGFDVVIGNPPYIRIQTLKDSAPLEIEFYKDYYSAASKGNYDIYVVFIERGLSLLNQEGSLGFIVPHKFFTAKYGEPIRDLLAKGMYLTEVVHFGDRQVFTGATTYTCLLFLNKTGSKECKFRKVDDLDGWRNTGEADEGSIPANKISASEWTFAIGRASGLMDKMDRFPLKLGDIANRIFQGPITSADKVFL